MLDGTVIVYEGTTPPPEPPEPPEPEPPEPPESDIDEKSKFPWVLYSNKLRKKRGGKNG